MVTFKSGFCVGDSPHTIGVLILGYPPPPFSRNLAESFMFWAKPNERALSNLLKLKGNGPKIRVPFVNARKPL